MDDFIFHRFDDIGHYNYNVIKVLNKLESLKIPSIAAVIPNKLDVKMAMYLKELNYCIIAQHGVDHINHVKSGWLDEFPEYMDQDDVKNKITKGKTYLEDIFGQSITTYIPPWNNTANSTIKILEKSNFNVYSSQSNTHVDSNMVQIPVYLDVLACYKPKVVLKSYNNIINEIQSFIYDGKLLGIMHHPNELLDREVDIAMRVIEYCRPMTIDYKKLKEYFRIMKTRRDSK